MPEKHDHLFNDHFKPHCLSSKGVTYLNWYEDQLYSFSVDKHAKKLCSKVEPFSTENGLAMLQIFYRIFAFIMFVAFLFLWAIILHKRIKRSKIENPRRDESSKSLVNFEEIAGPRSSEMIEETVV